MLMEGLDTFGRTEAVARFGADQPASGELDDALAEVRRRAELSPACYPLRVEQGSTIELATEVDAVPYWFLWLASQVPAPYREAAEFNRVNAVFDLLAREALRSYLGSGATALRFGVPVKDGRHPNLRQALIDLAVRMGIETHSLEDVKSTDQDGGVDVVAWRPLASGIRVVPCTLMQCTVQVNFKRKGSDIVPEMWTDLLRFGTDPQRALAVPFAVKATAEEIRDINWRSSLFLDRLSLCEHLDAAVLRIFQPEWDEMLDFVTEEKARQVNVRIRPTVTTGGRRRRR